MTVVVAASDAQWKELTDFRPDTKWIRVNSASAFQDHTQTDAFFLLDEKPDNIDMAKLQKPVFINSVVDTIADLQTPENVYRINGWATFLNRDVWEIAGKYDEEIIVFFKQLHIQAKFLVDEPGFVAARVIAMIINEAYLAVEENVSSRDEIDTAMKLGTNYPYGPFEWVRIIGARNILLLLERLAISDRRYTPAAQLVSEANEDLS